MMQSTKLITRNFIVMLPIGFSFAINFLIIYVTMAKYATDIYGATSTLAGLAASIFIFGSFASRLFFARSIEIIGMKRILVFASAIGFCICILYHFTTGYVELLAVRFAHGCVYGLCLLTANTLVAKTVPQSRRGEGMGYYMLAYTSAVALAPFISIILAGNGNYGTIFTVGAMFYLIAGGAALLLDVKRETFTAEQRREARRFKLDNMIAVSALRISAVAMIFFFAYSSVLTFMAQYGVSLGLVEATSVFFMVVALSNFLSRMFIGKLFDKHGENVIYIPVFLMAITALCIISFAHSGTELLLAAFMIGFGVALVNSTGQAVAVRDAGPGKYPVALSTFSMAMDIAYAAGPFAMGFLAGCFGYSGMYLSAAAICAFGLITYMTICARRPAKS